MAMYNAQGMKISNENPGWFEGICPGECKSPSFESVEYSCFYYKMIQIKISSSN